jgi:hypothetical protein
MEVCKRPSRFGIASFLIALFLGCPGVIYAVALATGEMRSGAQPPTHLPHREIATGIPMGCTSCVGISAGLLGAGVAIAGLIRERQRLQMFTWIGLLANVTVIIVLIVFYLIGVR